MAIPDTRVQKEKIIRQILLNLTGLQHNMRANAQRHRAQALAANPDVVTLAGFVQDCALKYLERLQWLIDLRNSPARRQRLLDMLTQMGWLETDITDVASPLRQAAIALRDAPKTTYAEIISACDSLLAFVDPIDSLWPE